MADGTRTPLHGVIDQSLRPIFVAGGYTTVNDELLDLKNGLFEFLDVDQFCGVARCAQVAQRALAPQAARPRIMALAAKTALVARLLGAFAPVHKR